MIASASAASSIGQFVTVFLIFLFVLAITWFATKYMANFQKEKSLGDNITVLETKRISQNKFIEIVKIADRCFALCVCKDTVTVITEISEDSLSYPEPIESKMSFKEFLNKAREDREEIK